MTKLKIVATLIAKESYVDALRKICKEVVSATRQEAGVISYALHQEVNNPLKFVILEEWKSQEAIDYHNNTPHFKAFVAAIDGKIDSLSIDILKEID